MKNQMNLKIESIEYHRNGVSGEGFYVVLFNDLEAKRKMIATIFSSTFEKNGECRCAVYDLAMLAEGNIAFGENSWRGDQYFYALRPLLGEKWLKERGYEICD